MGVNLDAFEAGHWMFIAAVVLMFGVVLMECLVWWWRRNTVKAICKASEKIANDLKTISDANIKIATWNVKIARELQETWNVKAAEERQEKTD